MAEIVLGTMTFGGSADLDLSRKILAAAADAGVTRVDTANMYTGGDSETYLGTLLREYSTPFEVASKVGNPQGRMHDAGTLARSEIIESVDRSLARLQIDSLDILYFHEPDRSTPIEESLAAMHELHQAGKIKRFGVSNYAAWQIEMIAEHCRAEGYLAPTISQQMYNLLARRLEHEYAEYATVTGLDTIVYNPLAGGMLARQLEFTSIPTDGRFGQSALGEYYRDRYWNEDQFAAVAALSDIAAKADMTLLELSLRWLVTQEVTHSILLGASRPEQITANAEALAKGPLPEDLARACGLATDGLLGSAPLYNR